MPFDVYKFQAIQASWPDKVTASQVVAAIEEAGGTARLEGHLLEISDEAGLVEAVSLDAFGA